MADALAGQLERSGAAGYVSQKQSPLGSRRHRAAVERRIEGHAGGAYRVGRNHFLTSEALVEELRGCNSTAASAPLHGGVGNDGNPTRLRKAKPKAGYDPALERLERDIRNGLAEIERDE
jgi:hypothetical protein